MQWVLNFTWGGRIHHWGAWRYKALFMEQRKGWSSGLLGKVNCIIIVNYWALMYVRPCSKCSTCIDSFNPHNNYEYIWFPFNSGETEAQKRLK